MQHRQRLRGFFRLIVFGSALAWTGAAAAQTLQDVPTPSNYGGVGLFDVRTARFLPDGYLSFTVSDSEPDDRYSMTVQALPWAEFTFRYSIIRAEQLYDRSFDLKFRLSHEGEYVPEIALGLQDILGTGVYSAEYLVASKQWGPFDFTLGLGWGRLGTRGTFENPFGFFSKSLLERPNSNTQGGVPLFSSYFRGPDMGVFGGIEYKTPIENLTVKVEYSSDAYKQEKLLIGKDYGFPVNAGISYRPFPWLDVGLSWMHGRYASFRVSTLIDAAAENWTSRLDPAPRFRTRPGEAAPSLLQNNAPAEQSGGAPLTRVVDLTDGRQTSAPVQQSGAPVTRFVDLTADRPAVSANPPLPNSSVAAAPPAPIIMLGMGAPMAAENTLAEDTLDANAEMVIRQGLATQELPILGLGREGPKLVILVENNHYRRDSEAIARVARILSAAAPPNLDYFEITLMHVGQPFTTVTLPRAQIDKLAQQTGSPAELFEATDIAPGRPGALDHIQPGLFPDVNTYLFPVFRQSLFDPDNPVYVRFGIGGSAGLRLTRGLFIEGMVIQSLYDNFGQIKRETNSVLPHVRSDFPHYLQEGKFEIANLMSSYFFKFAPEIYGRVSAGYLEEMFAGFGGELLYRPFGQRWAIGVDLWAVRQRDFNVLFGLRNYSAITGHISAYYELPWHDVRVAVSAGQYLAGDKGVTFELFRKFSTGVQIGAWFTLTNVSAERFGEGSFDKGIRIIIPFEWAAPFGTQTSYDLALRSIQRDGGQKLTGDTYLYGLTDASSYGTLLQEWNSVFR